MSRELSISPSLLQHWKHRVSGGARVAFTANEEVVPVSEPKAAVQRIKEMERALDTICTAERLGLSPVTTPAYKSYSVRSRTG